MHILSTNIAFSVYHNLAKCSLLHYGRKICGSGSTLIKRKGCSFSLLLPLLLLLTCYREVENPQNFWKSQCLSSCPWDSTYGNKTFSFEKNVMENILLAVLPRWFLQLWHSTPCGSWTNEAVCPDRCEVGFPYPSYSSNDGKAVLNWQYWKVEHAEDTCALPCKLQSASGDYNRSDCLTTTSNWGIEPKRLHQYSYLGCSCAFDCVTVKT